MIGENILHYKIIEKLGEGGLALRSLINLEVKYDWRNYSSL